MWGTSAEKNSKELLLEKICVMRLGYIGLPTASMLVSHGFDVLGVVI